MSEQCSGNARVMLEGCRCSFAPEVFVCLCCLRVARCCAEVTPVARGRSWSGACELPGARIARLATGAAPANDLQTLLLHEG